MDATIAAAPLVAEATVVAAVVTAIKTVTHYVKSLVETVTAFVRLSIGGTSLSAVAPDHILRGGTA